MFGGKKVPTLYHGLLRLVMDTYPKCGTDGHGQVVSSRNVSNYLVPAGWKDEAGLAIFQA